MLDTYIKNKGVTKTIIHNNNQHNISEISWDADYDGDIANLNIDLNQDGMREKMNIQLDNNDLAAILNIPSIKGNLEDRLERDFMKKQYNTPKLIKLYEDDDILTHISSPLPQEELIVPLKIVNRPTRKRRRRKRKSSSRRSSKSKRSYTRRITL